MLSNVPAMLDCAHAQLVFQFEGSVTLCEKIELEDDNFDWFCEMDRLLCIYEAEAGNRPYDEDSWIERAKEPGKVYFGFPEYMLAAATSLAAVFESYNSTQPRQYLGHTSSLVDHQGNISPLDIERK